TPEGSEEESNDEEDQELRLSEEKRIQEEEEAGELYRDVNINQGKGLQVTQNVEDSHVTLTLALVEAYVADKAILDTCGDSTILKRRREDDDQEGPSAGSNRGSKRQKKEVSMHQLALHPKQQPRVQAELPKGLNLDNCLPPLPLIPDNRARRVIPFDHFINNDLEYLQGGALSHKYTTSVTKTKAADYGHINWIEDLVPRAMWIQQPIYYNRHALWGVSHWGRKRQQFYGYAVNRESALDVYSKRRIIAVTELKIME
nr:hypothetical protein [Tanacetum cinerariifolium]